MDKIAEKRASLAEVLKKAQFIAFDGKNLSVSFNAEGAIVEGEKSWIERIISSELNHSVRLMVKVEKSAGKKAKKREEIPKEEIMKKIVSKSELLHKLVDEFDLEVI